MIGRRPKKRSVPPLSAHAHDLRDESEFRRNPLSNIRQRRSGCHHAGFPLTTLPIKSSEPTGSGTRAVGSRQDTLRSLGLRMTLMTIPVLYARSQITKSSDGPPVDESSDFPRRIRMLHRMPGYLKAARLSGSERGSEDPFAPAGAAPQVCCWSARFEPTQGRIAVGE